MLGSAHDAEELLYKRGYMLAASPTPRCRIMAGSR
jgi:hypothetical protein